MGLVSISCDKVRQELSCGDEKFENWGRDLEEGHVLFFPQSPITLPERDLQFLLGLKQNPSAHHKNLAYCAARNRISCTGIQSFGQASTAETIERLRGILRRYSEEVTAFLTQALPSYQARWQVDSTSFRPLEERGRHLSIHKRNDRMHIDAFPTRPTQGARILRFFQNIHPTQPREWIVGEPFRTLLPQFAPAEISLPQAENVFFRRFRNSLNLTCVGQVLGRALPTLKRSPYDRFMLRFHNYLKESDTYQASGHRQPLSFPAGSAWMIYTDTVPHAVLSGQFALEQTFLVSPEAMTTPEHAPLHVLESLTGQRLS